jgi:serine/threonine protein phosphatase PrpC
VKLAGFISEGSGPHNEDAIGFAEQGGEMVAAWVFDGVTGINGRDYLDASSDAAWIVGRANAHIQDLATRDISLAVLLAELVERLSTDWTTAAKDLVLPQDHDLPATCLLLAKRYADGWNALRLGDSFLLTSDNDVHRWDGPRTELCGLEALLRREAQRLRAQGNTDFKSLLQRFNPQLMASRRQRNTAGHHNILVPDQSSLAHPEFLDLGWPQSMLLCSDGFYRAVDTYAILDDAGLIEACQKPDGVSHILRHIRAIEADDPYCEKYLRFKPADDASALMMMC